MDIFTSVLTRVVPVPIKKHNSKIKAMAKITRLSKLSDDILGVEDHHQYPTTSQPKNPHNEHLQGMKDENECVENIDVYDSHSKKENENKHQQSEKDQAEHTKIKHIDEYI